MKFKIFICVTLTLIVLLQAAIFGVLIFGGLQVKKASDSAQATLNQKADTFNENTQSINDNLNSIKNELQNTPTGY